MKIESSISELLYHHDCVIVAGLGGFIAQYRPASINPALHVLSPPSKRVAFNAFLQMNDGLLANHIARKQVIDYNEANRQIELYVDETMKLMETGKKVKIEHVGTLYYDPEKNIQFSPDQHANFLITSFGMMPVHAPVIRREEVQRPAFAEEQVQLVPEIRVHKKIRKPGWRLIEMIPAAAVVAILFISPPALKRVNEHLSTLLPFSRMEEFVHAVKTPEAAKPIAAPAKTVNIFDIPPKNPYKAARLAPLTTSEVDAVEQPVAAAQPSEYSYHIIGGTFRIESNAEKFALMMQQKGMKSSVVGQNSDGLYLVSIYSAPTESEANAKLEQFRNDHDPQAWIFKK